MLGDIPNIRKNKTQTQENEPSTRKTFRGRGLYNIRGMLLLVQHDQSDVVSKSSQLASKSRLQHYFARS